MIRAILVDDEPNALRNLKWEIERFCPEIEIVESSSDPQEAISAIDYLKPDCVFLDIEMPEMDGFQLLQKLKYKEFDLIVTTAYDSYAIRAFKEHALDYLLKPIDSDDLKRSVSRIKKNKNTNSLGTDLRQILQHISKPPTVKKIGLQLPGQVLYVEPDEIIYCRSSGNYTEIYFTDSTKELMSRKLKEVEAMLDNENFFRVHNSYLVNLDHVKVHVKSEGQYLIMDNQSTIPISRTKREELNTLLNRR